MIIETLLAPAKINWSLKVGKLMPNGLHELRTEIQKISLCDRIEITINSEQYNSRISFNVEANSFCAAPSDESNLVIRAIRAFFGTEAFPEMEVTLQKKIPSEAGLGGGSSDAAAVLRYLVDRFPKPPEEVGRIATALGSELPFFMHDASSAIVTGTGEIITPVQAEAVPIILCLPEGAKVSTAWAFQRWDALGETVGQNSAANDFEALVFRRFPELENICAIFRQAGATYAGLSGSGAAVFAAFSGEIPTYLIGRLEQEKYWVWCGQTLT